MDDARIFEAHHHAHGMGDFLFALAWSDTDRDRKLFEEKARGHFEDIARIMGYRVEKVSADPARTLAYVDAGRPVRGANLEAAE